MSNISSIVYWETPTAYYIGVYCQLIIATVGIVGNILAFLTFGRYTHQSASMLYLQLLAVADMISLFWDGYIATPLPQLGIRTESSSYWMCKLGRWHNSASSTVSSWLLMVVAIDRAVALNCATFYKQRCTRKTAVVVIVCVWIFAYALCSPAIYFMDFKALRCSTTLSGDPVKMAAGKQFTLFINFGALFVLPFFGIMLANIMIVKKLHDRRKIRQAMRNPEKTDPDKSSDENEILWLLFSDSGAFGLLAIFVGFACLCCVLSPQTDHEKAMYTLIGTLCEFVSCIQEGIRFFLYYAFSKNFRRTFSKMIRCQSGKGFGSTSMFSDRTSVTGFDIGKRFSITFFDRDNRRRSTVETLTNSRSRANSNVGVWLQ